MTLRLALVDNPAAGVDWQTLIPGQWVYDIVAVAAKLTTGPSIPPGLAVDATGNGNDGLYNPSFVTPIAFSQPGLVGGDTAITFGTPFDLFSFARFGQGCFGPGDVISLEFWMSAGDAVKFGNVTPAGSGFNIDLTALTWSFGTVFEQQNGVFVDPAPAGPHMVTVTFSTYTGTMTLRLNGVLVVTAFYIPILAPVFAAGVYDLGGVQVGATDLQTVGTVDELAGWPVLLTAGQIAAHYAAAAVSFAAYSAAVLADTPNAYFHLDETVTPNPARSAALVVSAGAAPVAAFPTSVAQPDSTASIYTWQVGIPNNTVTPASGSAVVGIPKLVLPAGYTLGAQTANLTSGDQWSDIVVWWNDTYSPDASWRLLPYDYHNLLLLG